MLITENLVIICPDYALFLTIALKQCLHIVLDLLRVCVCVCVCGIYNVFNVCLTSRRWVLLRLAYILAFHLVLV
jgi:hypothetical protein